MFQVASHPSAFGVHPHNLQHAAPIHAAHSVQLPRTLARPAFTEVSNDAITAVAPELASVPPEYIRRGLRSKAPQMLAGVSAASSIPSSLPRSHVPKSLAVPLRSAPTPDPSYPTHILAVCPAKSASGADQAALFPVHALVLASHCASLPRLPSSSAQASQSAVTLPVIPLSLPSPAAFSILNSYMYTHRLDTVLKALFPVPSTFVSNLSYQTVRATLGSGNSLHQLSAYLCQSAGSNLQLLTTHAAHVKDLWQDMVALGLYDPELWDTLDLAWEIVLGALNLAATAK
ncbi:hypothetical protein BDN72DRAFT_831850 [Pluteus cervinus]|uniref:Uncharacterized protein n=1 Tax=Pluteus cervinus TaxID=181527 RepID=A0ACD3BDA7_9AGAR|nr:hypothetical protein BDN72DRAFT_831850 [Pluteus cervinus]